MVKPRASNIRVHTSDMWMTYEYIRMTYGWHTSAYEWHTKDLRGNTSDIRMTYEYIRVTYRWHMGTYKWHTNDLRVTWRWHVVRKKNKVNFLKAFYKFPFKISDLWKNSLHALTVLGFLPKLKRGLELAFGAHFLLVFFSYKCSSFNTLSVDKVLMSYLF